MTLKVHVVTHTHWDREWYLSFEIFRTRLLELLDHLREGMDRCKAFKSFTLDGQTVILEDYFQLRPEKKEELLSLIREKKVDVGPWYILPDEFLITGESFIRNFLVAFDILEDLGVEGIDIGYLPDMFGHSAYTPSILKDLGLKAAILWRGVGDKSRKTEFIWKSPNGDEILTVNLLHSYSNGAHFGKEISEIKEVFKHEVETLSSSATTNNILIMNGTDHEFPLYELISHFEEWEKELGDVRFIHSRFSSYVEDVIKEAPKLEEVTGELKSPKYEFILKDVTSARIYIKLANFSAQKILTRYAEPLSAYLWWTGETPEFNRIDYAWKLLLKSHPHDSICGCSIDEVHRDVEGRLRSSQEVALSVVAESLKKLSEYIPIEPEKGMPFLVFNPYEYERDAIVTAFLPIDIDKDYELTDDAGNLYEFYIDNSKELKTSYGLEVLTFLSQYKEAISPAKVASSSFKNIVASVKGLPSLGFKILYLREKGKREEVEKKVETSTTFENEFYKFELNEDGSFNLRDKLSGVKYENLNYLEDVGDAGDEYNFSWLPDDLPVNSLDKPAKVLEVRDAEFEKVIRLHKEFEIPLSLTSNRKARTIEKAILPIELTYRLLKHKPRIDVELTLTNTAKDHKLSFVVEVPEKLDSVLNDSYFGLVTHPADFRNYGEGYTEEDISRYAMESFALIKGKKSKLSIATQGIHEYESHIVNEKTKLTFTLLRAVGWLSRDDLTTRKGHAGPFLPTPEAQCIGTYTYKYSFVMLETAEEKEVYKKVRDYLYEPIVLGVPSSEKKPKNCVFPQFNFEEGVILSAFKVSRRKDGLIMRVFSQSDKDRKLTLKGITSSKVWNANMREDRLELISTGESASVPISPYKIKTLLFTKDKGGEGL